jgi:hypothetical protein
MRSETPITGVRLAALASGQAKSSRPSPSTYQAWVNIRGRTRLNDPVGPTQRGVGQRRFPTTGPTDFDPLHAASLARADAPKIENTPDWTN